jgi:hypothetical protein
MADSLEVLHQNLSSDSPDDSDAPNERTRRTKHRPGRGIAPPNGQLSFHHIVKEKPLTGRPLRYGPGTPAPRQEGNALERRVNPKRASAFRRLRPVAGTDLRREQRPGAAGHRELLVLRARVRDARNGKRALASQGVRLCGGEKL